MTVLDLARPAAAARAPRSSVATTNAAAIAAALTGEPRRRAPVPAVGTARRARRGGPAPVLLLVGEPGIGKTRLLDHLAERGWRTAAR